MAQRYDIVRIDFQANSRGANAAIESLRRSAEECNERVTLLKKDLKDGIKMGKSTQEIENIRKAISSAQKEAKQFTKGYNELAKGMRTLDTAIKAFNDGSLNQMSQAFQKAANNAAKLTRTKLDPMSDSYKEDYRQLTALMDATQQNFARMQGDAQQMIKTLKNGGKVAVAALQEELTAQRELKSVLSETDKGYQRTVKNIAVLEQYLRAMGGDYEFVRQNITDTKKVSDDMLRSMHKELQQTNAEGKVTKDIMRENAQAMKEIRAEQARRVESVLGGNLGRQSEQSIRTAIANAKELLLTYKTNSKEAQTLSAQIINAEEHLKTHGIEAARVAAREAAAIKTQEEAEKQLQTTMNKRLTSLKTLSADALAETRKYWEAQRNGAEQGSAAYNKAEVALKRIDNLQKSRRVGELDNILTNPSKHGINEVRNALQEMEKLRDSVQKGIPVWQHYNKMVEQGRAYLDNLAKSEASQRITAQMQQLTHLSAKGLAEVKAYWQAQIDGATRGSQAYTEAESAMKRITRLEETRKQAGAFRVINNMGQYGDEEIRRAIQTIEQLRDAQAHGSRQWEVYNKRVQEGKAYLDEWAKTDSIVKMEERMTRLPQLSDTAMQETKKFWETMVAGADKGSRELAEYEAHLQKVMQEESERKQLSNEITVQRLGGNLSNLSEKEIREAIEAGKQLIQTYKTASPEAEALAKKIVSAEEHLKQYGVEAERAARKEAQAIAEAAKKRQEVDDLMKSQLQSGVQLSQSALRAQEQYWQRLIDDPKTAATSLQEYKNNLEQVRLAQQRLVNEKGADALAFFRGDTSHASADKMKEQADALKKLRDSMPQKENAKLIAEIDGYLDKVGSTAQKAAEQTMSLKEALKVGAETGRGSFKGTTEQLILAKKTLEELQQKAIRGGYAWRRMQESIDNINLELKRTGFISKEVDAILKAPKGKSFNELKLAVEQGRAALQNMRTVTTQEKKDFDELAKKVKEAEFQMKELGNASKGTASAFDKAWPRLKTYIGLYMGDAVAIQKLTATMGDLMELSDKRGGVRKTTGFTADEVGRLSEELKKMDTRTTLTGLMDLSVAAGQLGLKTQEDVLGFTEAANKLMVALPEMGKEGATEMLKVALATGEIDKIRKQMEAGLIDGSSATAVAMEKVGSTIDRLRATSAATAPAITDFVKRVGAVGAQSGISIDQVAALGSTVDALGMRVEMSATALSRMMPAIRNNAFDIAKILGVTPNSIRELYDAGKGMDVILMILQHMKDANMDADSIEKMLGMGGMQEIMKELNQQGARAGIVFGGLSQNVDELRRQLGVAKQAYEENIAIQQEYDKMNETTAAKWERLKNQVEEYFVGDRSQQWLGGIIDGLRVLVDLITGPLEGAFKSFMTGFSFLKLGIGGAMWKYFISYIWMGIKNISELGKVTTGLGTTITQVKTKWVDSWKKMDAATKANWILAIVSAVYMLGKAIFDAATKVSELDQAFAKLQADEEAAERDINRLTDSFAKSAVKADEATKKHAELEEQTNSLRNEVDSMKKSTDLSAEAQEALRKKSDELKVKEGELKKATDEMNKANKERSGLISEINSKYSSYLGYMLSEVTNADLVASAHWRIVAALRAELEKKRALENQKAIEEKYGEDIKEYTQDSRDELKNLPRDVQDMIMRRWSNMMGQVSYNIVEGKDKNGRPTIQSSSYTVPSIEGIGNRARTFKTEKEASDYLQSLLTTIVQQEAVNKGVSLSGYKNKTEYKYNPQTLQWERKTTRVKDNKTASDYARQIWGGGFDDGFGNLASTQLKRMEEQERQRFYDQGSIQGSEAQVTKRTLADIQANAKDIAATIKKNETLNSTQIHELGRELNAVVQSSLKYEGNNGDVQLYFGAGNEMTLENAANTLLKNLDAKTRQQVLAAARTNQRAGTGGTTTPTATGVGGAGGSTIWGNDVDATSTDYGTWDVTELVARRNQMNKFKNVLKPGINVRKVLAEDSALMKAINEGKVGEDWQSVLNWYNAERKKIQQELKSERFSTNEGNWRDEKTKKGRKRTNPLIESDYALAELDRYYSRRKEALEKARSEENISEELYNRQAEMLEQEHLERRSKLRGTFTGKVSKEETEAFRKWWANLEKLGELDNVPWATVESEWSKAIAAQIGRNNLKMQQDMTQVKSITMKHVNQIAKIIAKERPYDGITENLQANLTKLDILFADLGTVTKEQLEDGSLTKELNRRMSFLLDETERAYTLTTKQLDKDMREKGFASWADALSGENGDELKRQLLANLQKAYDAVQDAIKKEASQIKKQAEIQWNDTVLPNGQSQKQAFDSALSALGLQEDQVKRANSLIGAGPASERVADKLAIKQMQVRLAMQEQYYALIKKIGYERIAQLEAAGKLEDAEHLRKSLNLTLSEEQKKTDEQRVAIQNQLEESQNRLYTELKSWADLFASSTQSLFEASHAGDKEYYNELAKLNLTGNGGPGAGTYIVIDNEGTSDASAHYEYLDERQALERQREIERQNAQAEAWRKVMDDINMKMSESITDWMNATLQNASIDANTDATVQNTQAVVGLTEAFSNRGTVETPTGPSGNLPIVDDNDPSTWSRVRRKREGLPADQATGSGGGETPVVFTDPANANGLNFDSWYEQAAGNVESSAARQVAAIDKVSTAMQDHFHKQVDVSKEANEKTQTSTQSMFAKMTQAANMYGIAYQVMSNDNMSATQKFEMMALQAAGNAAISMLEVEISKASAKAATDSPGVLGTLWKQLGWAAAPVFAIFTGLLGGLMGMATSKIAKSKSQIAAVTGSSVGAGRLSTGMLTYAEGNVNEFTDPAALTPGRQYNVDAADGRTYRARYMGRNPRTHITNGPEFHLSGEKGREMIIDAGTTRQITMNETEIWHAIQTLSAGRRVSSRRHRRGVSSFAEGNIEDFVDSVEKTDTEETKLNIDAMRTSLDRNSAVQEALLERLSQPIQAKFDVFGKGGLIDSYDKGKRTTARYGEKY